MKKILLAVLCVFPMVSFAQKIEKNIIDDFTGKQVLYTSWATFHTNESKSFKMTSQVRFRYENDVEYMQIRIITGNTPINYTRGAKILFKTDQDSVYALKNMRTVTTEKTGYFVIQFTGDFDFLLTSNVEKIRYYFNEGYFDIELKAPLQNILKRSFALLVLGETDGDGDDDANNSDDESETFSGEYTPTHAINNTSSTTSSSSNNVKSTPSISDTRGPNN